jgi:hypothetical protein
MNPILIQPKIARYDEINPQVFVLELQGSGMCESGFIAKMGRFANFTSLPATELFSRPQQFIHLVKIGWCADRHWKWLFLNVF